MTAAERLDVRLYHPTRTLVSVHDGRVEGVQVEAFKSQFDHHFRALRAIASAPKSLCEDDSRTYPSLVPFRAECGESGEFVRAVLAGFRADGVPSSLAVAPLRLGVLDEPNHVGEGLKLKPRHILGGFGLSRFGRTAVVQFENVGVFGGNSFENEAFGLDSLREEGFGHATSERTRSPQTVHILNMNTARHKKL